MWEIDCENKLLSVYDYPIFSWQGISFQLDLVGTQFIIRDFPFRFRHENEYVRPRADLVMDTGSPESLVYLYAVPDSMMRLALSDRDTRKYACPSKNSVTPTLYLLHEYGLLDRNLWIEHRNLLPQWHISGEREMIVAGMDFLKSFNLRLYPAKHRIELIPIAHISLQEDQSRQKGNEDFRIRAFLSREGDAVVDFVKEGSYWQSFGVKEGDVILDVDGHRLFDLPRLLSSRPSENGVSLRRPRFPAALVPPHCGNHLQTGLGCSRSANRPQPTHTDIVTMYSSACFFFCYLFPYQNLAKIAKFMVWGYRWQNYHCIISADQVMSKEGHSSRCSCSGDTTLHRFVWNKLF